MFNLHHPLCPTPFIPGVLKLCFKLIFYSFIFLFSVKNQRTKQALCKTSLTWNTNDAQLNNDGGRWSTPAATQVQCFVSPVGRSDFIHRTLLSEVVYLLCKSQECVNLLSNWMIFYSLILFLLIVFRN